MKRLELLLVKSAFGLFKRIPLCWGHKITQTVSFVLRKIVKYRCDTVHENLKKSFPEKSSKECKTIELEVYYNFSALWLEFLQNWRINESYVQQYFSVHNWKAFENAEAEKKGLILLTGHIGNMEWLGQFMSLKLTEVYAIGQEIKNEFVHDFVEKIRTQHGAKVINKKGAMKRCLEILKDKKVLAIAGDQDARKKGIFVDFFGNPSSTAVGTALLHLKTGAPIVFATPIRKKWGQFDIYFERLPDSDNLECTDQNIFNVTQLHTKILEKWIRKFPSQYFWTHKRWKTLPNPEEKKNYDEFLKKSKLEFDTILEK